MGNAKKEQPRIARRQECSKKTVTLREVKEDKKNQRRFDIVFDKVVIGRCRVQTIFSQTDCLWIDKLFIENEWRCQGVGSQVICLLEGLTSEMRREKIRAEMKSLDRAISQEKLENFYLKNGFVKSEDFPDHVVMEKVLKGAKRKVENPTSLREPELRGAGMIEKGGE